MAQLLRERGQFVYVKGKEWLLVVFGIYQQQKIQNLINEWNLRHFYKDHERYFYHIARMYHTIIRLQANYHRNWIWTHHLQRFFSFQNYADIPLLLLSANRTLQKFLWQKYDKINTSVDLVLEVGRGCETEVGYMEQLGSLIKADSNGNDNARKQWPDWINEEI